MEMGARRRVSKMLQAATMVHMTAPITQARRVFTGKSSSVGGTCKTKKKVRIELVLQLQSDIPVLGYIQQPELRDMESLPESGMRR